MHYEVSVETAPSVLIAAVSATVHRSEIARAWKPALDQVWAFMRSHPDIKPGRNLFLYHHPANRNEPMNIDFGVEIAHSFDPAGNVRCAATPSGQVATTLHVGPYDRLGDAHQAIHAWCAANNRKIGQASWEVYGHWNNDPALLQTTIKYLLA